MKSLVSTLSSFMFLALLIVPQVAAKQIEEYAHGIFFLAKAHKMHVTDLSGRETLVCITSSLCIRSWALLLFISSSVQLEETRTKHQVLVVRLIARSGMKIGRIGDHNIGRVKRGI
ncbi:hypothetical protein P8452_27849 [Trifolium repens]|nr:hypothetical protein P8452_27849 [Trifolium repens]